MLSTIYFKHHQSGPLCSLLSIIDESRQLKKLSGGYKIEFAHLIKPYANNKHLKIHAGPDMDELFFVDDPKSYYHYYLAEVKMAMSW